MRYRKNRVTLLDIRNFYEEKYMINKSVKVNTKENILQAWIMVERLQEGNLDKKAARRFRKLGYDDDFYYVIKNSLGSKPSTKSGILLICDKFPVEDVIRILQQDSGYKEDGKEVSYPGERFSFSIRFDSHLNLIGKKTFVTACGYIKNEGNIPTYAKFLEYQSHIKKKIEESFVVELDERDETELAARANFNKAVKSILEGECYYCKLEDIEHDFQNFNSFFAKDLEKVMEESTSNLDKYLTSIGNNEITAGRVNLDTKKEEFAFNKESNKFNRIAIADILQPKNFPLSRYPSDPDYALSLMQQVAVNIATGYGNQQMRSVNGPPGTGKSTLLYDVFAELVVEQAYEMAKMSARRRQILDGKLPENISDKNIIVASSNNAAIKNIVDELPQIKKIHDGFKDLLVKTDYFLAIANGEESNAAKYDSVIEDTTCMEKWGLFSMEGGKVENVKKLFDTVQRVVDELYNENFQPHEEVYQEFLNLYDEVLNIRNDLQTRADNIVSLEKDELEEKCLSEKLEKDTDELEKIEEERNRIKERLDEVKSERPPFFFIPWIAESREYKKELKSCRRKSKDLRKEKERLQDELVRNSELRKGILHEIDDLKTSISASGERNGGVALDFNVPYEKLQLSSPWFTRNYREKQSKLFVLALAVRKQFLYENRNNVKDALLTLAPDKDKQTRKKASDEKICEAWEWMNLVIPVISTTFSSAARMFDKLGREGIGNLFIDEAGQAVPWAAIGLIYRSKRVMAVGDPSQIEPVLTLDEKILEFIRDVKHISGEYLSNKASVQSLMDSAGTYGFYKNENEWIGIPLWVHRRCKSPMFDISNEISYDGNMVPVNTDKGHAEWWDIRGIAQDKYVEEQGEIVKDFIQAIRDGKFPEYNTKKIYVITPFRNVAEKLAEKLDKIGFTKREDSKPINVGTVHTFQGKETDTVIVVLGADERSRLAANWAMGSDNANMMNVAATRAKNTLIIVGDKELYEGLESKVINKTIQVINHFDSGNSLLAKLQ